MRILIAATALALLLPAMPAAAQRSTGPAPAPALPTASGIGPSLGRTSDAIRDARRSGQLSRGEAKRARRENAQIGTLNDRYAADGYLSDSERRELETRSEVLRATVNAERWRGGK